MNNADGTRVQITPELLETMSGAYDHQGYVVPLPVDAEGRRSVACEPGCPDCAAGKPKRPMWLHRTP